MNPPYLLADTLVVGLGMTWGVLIPVAGLWAAPLFFLQHISAWQVGAIAVALVLLFSTGPQPVPHPWRRASVAVAAGVIAALVGGIAAPALIGDDEPRSLAWLDAISPDQGTVHLTSNVEVGQNLGRQSTSVAYRYRDVVTDAPPKTSPRATALSEAQREPMRLTTFVTFDGLTWSARQQSDARTPVGSEILQTVPFDVAQLRDGFSRTVTLQGLIGDEIPLTVAPTSAAGVEGGTFDTSTDELRRRNDSTQKYTLLVRPTLLNSTELRKADASDTDLGPEYTAVAATTHIDEITDLAAQITAGTHNQYDALVAIQNYLRDPQRFTYTTEVAPTEDNDPVWTFLTHRHGYCVQFATTMAVMARTLGIPTRLAQGFLPGTSDANGEVVVTGQQAHAWPEFYFSGVGWVRFEPTPAVQTGDAPLWTQSTASPTPTPTPSKSATPTPSKSATAKPSTPTKPPSATSISAKAAASQAASVSPATMALAAAALMLLVGAGLAAGLLLRRRQRPLGVEASWAQVLRAARRADVVGTRATTPRQWGQLMADRLDPDAGIAVWKLVEALENERYADSGPTDDAEPTPEADIRDWVRTVTVALRASRNTEKATRESAESGPRSR